MYSVCVSSVVYACVVTYYWGWLGSPRLFESLEYDLIELGESVPLMSGESSLGFLDIVALCVVAQLLHNYSILP